MFQTVVQAAVCKVSCGEEIGTGFLVKGNRVLTTSHCVRDAIDSSCQVQLTFRETNRSSEIEIEAKVEAYDRSLDACLLSISDISPRTAIPTSPNVPREGVDWFSFGFPEGKTGLGHRLSGRIANVLPAPHAKVDIDLSVDPEAKLQSYSGMSGGPVVAGETCVGMLRVRLNGSIAAISTEALGPFLQRNGVQTDPGGHAEDAKPPLAHRTDFQHLFEAQIAQSGGKYLFLEGAHGIGKTTFCDRFVASASSILHLGTYCVREPHEKTNTAVRSQPNVLFDWLLTTISSLLTGKPDRQQALNYAEMARTVAGLLERCSDYCRSRNQIGLLFIDGLNEVFDISPELLTSFLGILPQTPPAHLTIVLAAPNHSIVGARLSGRVSNQDVRGIPPLSYEAGRAYCRDMLVDELQSDATFVRELCRKANGHPLYLNYLIRRANANPDDKAMGAFPVLDGPIEDYYEKLWLNLFQDDNAINLLSIIARMREGLDSDELVKVLRSGEQAVFPTTLLRIQHLFLRKDRLTIYHDSFRAFLLHKTAQLDAPIQERLADFCLETDEVSYCIRNRMHHLLKSTENHRLRAIRACDQDWVDACVMESVEPDILLSDLNAVLDAALERGDTVEVIRLLLLCHRVSFRYDTLFAQSAKLVAEALIALGRPGDALKHVVRYNHLIVAIDEALQISWCLIEFEYFGEAIELLQLIERTCIDTYSHSEMRMNSFVHITITHILTALFLRVSGERHMRYVLYIQQENIKTIRSNLDDSDSANNYFTFVVSKILGVPNNYFFTFCDTYSTNAQLKKVRPDLEIPDDRLLAMRVDLLLDHLESVENYRLTKDRVCSAQLLADIAEVVARGRFLKPEQLPDVVDALIRVGAAPELVTCVVGDRRIEPPKQVSLRKPNGVDADYSAVYQNGKRWRAKGFIDREAEYPLLTKFDSGGWLTSIERLFNTTFYLEGRARRAKVDGDEKQLKEVRDHFLGCLLPGLEFDLAERTAWERSYAIPEAAYPFLVEILTEVVVDCFPEDLSLYLESLKERCTGQLGLYSEGFRECICRVVEYVSRAETDTNVTRQLYGLLESLRDHVVTGVENRHELIPELLRLIVLFNRVGATEEAERMFRKVLAFSMGPTWYKEDQFGLMISALSVIPHDCDVTQALPRIAGYLDRASGEMTFQRYVRNEKASLIGALVARNQCGNACNYFRSQSCGDQDRLFREWESSPIDAPTPRNGRRRPGGAIEEQDAVLRIVRNAPEVTWRLKWALLEIFQFGDFRHLGDYAEEYAKLINENGQDQRSFDEMVKRIDAIVSTDVPSGKHAVFLAALRANLVETYIEPFAKLFLTDSACQDHTKGLKQLEDSNSKREAGDPDESDERFFYPGVFGRQSVFRKTDSLLEEARAELDLGNREAAKTKCVEILQTVQNGEWIIWEYPHESTVIADSILKQLASNASELVRLYRPLVAAERHTPSWRIADHLISQTSGLLEKRESQGILDVVLDHVRQMVGDASQEIAQNGFLGESGLFNDTFLELFSFLLGLLDHPQWLRREKAAEMILWLATKEADLFEYIVRTAFESTEGWRAEVACGVLEIASFEAPVETWQQIERVLNVEAILKENRHVSRLATLYRLASRAVKSGFVAEQSVTSRITELFRAGNIVLASTNGLTLPKWARCAETEWRSLEKLGIASRGLLDDWTCKLSEICSPYKLEEVFELENVVSETFRVPKRWPLNRWASKVLFSLNCSLFPYVSVVDLDNVESILRVYNPCAPCRSRKPFFESRFGRIRQCVEMGIDYSPAICDAEHYLLHYAEVAEIVFDQDARRLFHVEVIAVLVSTSMRRRGFFVPEVTECFGSRYRWSTKGSSAGHETNRHVVPDCVFFGSFTPAVPLSDFLDQISANESDCTRTNWRNDRSDDFDYFGRPISEGCSLSIRKTSVKLPDNQKLAWIIKVNDEVVTVVDADNNELF